VIHWRHIEKRRSRDEDLLERVRSWPADITAAARKNTKKRRLQILQSSSLLFVLLLPLSLLE
jgi:hypothetical protein